MCRCVRYHFTSTVVAGCRKGYPQKHKLLLALSQFTENAMATFDLKNEGTVFGHLTFVFRDIENPDAAAYELKHMLLAPEGTHESTERDTIRARLKEMFASVNIVCLRIPHSNLRNFGGTIPDSCSCDAQFLDEVDALKRLMVSQCRNPRVISSRELTVGLLHPMLVDIVERLRKGIPFAPQDVLEARDEHCAKVLYDKYCRDALTKIAKMMHLEAQCRQSVEDNIRTVIADSRAQFTSKCAVEEVRESVIERYDKSMDSRTCAAFSSTMRCVLDEVANRTAEHEVANDQYLENASRNIPRSIRSSKGMSSLLVVQSSLLLLYTLWYIFSPSVSDQQCLCWIYVGELLSFCSVIRAELPETVTGVHESWTPAYKLDLQRKIGSWTNMHKRTYDTMTLRSIII